MAQEQSGPTSKTPWTKIFTGFKVAFDLKKLLLAAAGIFLTFVGWWLLSASFYYMHTFPVFVIKLDKPASAESKAEWVNFKAKRASWNLLHELAAPVPDLAKRQKHEFVDAADVATDLEEYKILSEWEESYRRLSDPVIIKDNTLELQRMDSNVKTFKLSAIGEPIPNQTVKLETITLKGNLIEIGEFKATVEGKIEELKKYRDSASLPSANGSAEVKALKTFNTYLLVPRYKPAGRLRVSPWSEERGGNPYLLVADTLKNANAAGTSSSLVNWLLSEKSLVLVEPLVKFLAPVAFLFDSRAGGWVRLYLICIILWTLIIWGFFGGAISRIAALQVARNERISLREALSFTRERFASYVAAPVFPMVLLAILTLVLVLFGWVEWIPYFIGDLFAGLLWPIVILFGFIMAIVLVGLIGWPLMTATISTEGTDSFDALSRSYSYIYQAPWQYLWCNFLAIAYGAVLVFFVGFMASLLIFLGKWGVGSAPGLASADPEKDREPSYLFMNAPTSYGWRDLMLSNSQFVEKTPEIAPNGREVMRLDFTPEYKKSLRSYEYTGAFLVSVWTWPLFLLVLGFSYSYFWSASTIIYFLMRRYVDDTEMDEVHLDDEEFEDPFLKQTPPVAPSAPPPASKPGTLSLNIVEPPTAPPPVATPTPPAPLAPAPMPPAPPLAAPMPPAPMAPTPMPSAPPLAAPELPPKAEPEAPPPDVDRPKLP